jgi:hypothetical protein
MGPITHFVNNQEAIKSLIHRKYERIVHFVVNKKRRPKPPL